MATDVQEELKTFEFNSHNVKQGDRFHLDHDGGQIVIVITDTEYNGRSHNSRDIIGIAADRQGEWCGPWGRIIFYHPIELGKETDATFNQRGVHIKRLEVVPTQLVRVRDGKHEQLLG